MKILNWRRLLLTAPLLAAAVFGAWWLTRDNSAASTPRATLVETAPVSGVRTGVRKGDVARDFEATSPEGTAVRLGDLRGEPVVINFWATWCPSCLAEMPDLRDIQNEIGAEHLHVVAVNSGEGAATARGFLATLVAPDFRVAMDPTLAVSDAYGVYGLSTSVFVDAAGVIRATYVGQMTKELMREYVTAASSAQTAPEPRPRLRLPGSVQARRRLIDVRETSGSVEFRGKPLRCDDTYCADAIIDTIARLPGVISLDRRTGDDPPTISVGYESHTTSAAAITAAITDLVQQSDDPLYSEKPLEVEQR